MRFSILVIVGLLISGPAMAQNRDGTFCNSIETHAIIFGEEFIELNLKPHGDKSNKRRNELITEIIPSIVSLMKNLDCDLKLITEKLNKTSCFSYRNAGIYPNLNCRPAK
jgi:hypothetical protein